ncbi:hypothetical protein EC988_007375, partial [Linderina pennispora]
MSSRRRSTRAAKAPERLDSTPAAPKKRANKTRSARTTASNKRQKTPRRAAAQQSRVSDDGDDESASEVADSDNEDDLDETSDYEARQKLAPRTPRKQMTAAKKPRATPQQQQQQRKKKQAAKAAEAPTGADMEIAADESLLLSTIQDDKVALAQVASDWIDSYRDNIDEALCELINFVLKLAGCPSKITEAAVYDADEIGSVLEGLQKQCIVVLKQGGA